MAPSTSPAIERLSWGRLEIRGHGAFRDAKLWPGGAREWDWRETGTGHREGIRPADVEELVEHGVEVVVLTRGRLGALRIPDETVAALEARGVEVVAARTAEGLERYRQLREAGRRVGALVHSTC